MLTDKNLRGFIMLEMAIVYFIELVLVVISSRIIKMGDTVEARMALMVAVYAGLTGVAVIIFYCGKGHDGVLGFSRQKVLKQILIGLVICAVTLIITVIIPLLAGVNAGYVLGVKSTSVPILIFYLFYSFIIVGFGEEIIFRGYFYNRVKDVTGIPWMPMLVSAVLFGILHYPSSMSFVNMLVTFALGFLYGYCRWKIKDCSLLSLALAHGLQDAVIVLMTYFLL